MDNYILSLCVFASVCMCVCVRVFASVCASLMSHLGGFCLGQATTSCPVHRHVNMRR